MFGLVKSLEARTYIGDQEWVKRIKKKSNAYKLKNKYTECEIIVVNIHLKRMFEEANRIKELNFIYKVLENLVVILIHLYFL